MIEGSNSMPTETKKSTAKASCRGSELVAALWLRSDSCKTIPAKKAPSAKETPKSLAEPKAMPSATASTHSVKSSRDPVRATCRSIQGRTRGPTNRTIAMNAATLASVMPSTASNPRSCRPVAAVARVAAKRLGEGRQEHQSQYHGQILNDQPADRDTAIRCLDRVALLKRFQQYDGACDGKTKAQYQAGTEAPTPRDGHTGPYGSGNDDLSDGAGYRNPAHGDQIGD